MSSSLLNCRFSSTLQALLQRNVNNLFSAALSLKFSAGRAQAGRPDWSCYQLYSHSFIIHLEFSGAPKSAKLCWYRLCTWSGYCGMRQNSMTPLLGGKLSMFLALEFCLTLALRGDRVRPSRKIADRYFGWAEGRLRQLLPRTGRGRW